MVRKGVQGEIRGCLKRKGSTLTLRDKNIAMSKSQNVVNVVGVVAVVVTVIRFLMYMKRNPKKSLGNDINKMYLSKFIFYFCDVWSIFMFWVIFWSCGSIFIRYKLQKNAT